MAFCNVMVGEVAEFVSVQVICAPGRMLAAGMVTTAPIAAPKLAGFPVSAVLASTHVADVSVKFG